jgi:GNAT superfamily N-acetyltransferase
LPLASSTRRRCRSTPSPTGRRIRRTTRCSCSIPWVVDPRYKGKGYGSSFVGFYEEEAAKRGCTACRIDTNERNASARRLYARLGYKEVDIVPCNFNGIPHIQLVCLEKLI